MIFLLLFFHNPLLVFIELNLLKSVNLHHKILSFFLVFEFFYYLLFLVQLIVSNCHDFGVHDHFIHRFYIVNIFLMIFRCSFQQKLPLFLFFDLELIIRNLFWGFLLKLLHSKLFGFCCFLLFLPLLVQNFLLMQLLFFGCNDRLILLFNQE